MLANINIFCKCHPFKPRGNKIMERHIRTMDDTAFWTLILVG